MMARQRHRERALGNGLAREGVSSATVDRGMRGGVVEWADTSYVELLLLTATSGGCSHGRLPQGEAAHHVVRERKPQQHGTDLFLAPNQHPGEPHAARPSIGTLGLAAFLVQQALRSLAIR